MFTRFTTSIPIALVSFMLQAEDGGHLRGCGLVWNVLDRLCLREVRGIVERCFLFMWESGRVVLEVPPPSVKDVIPKRI